MSVTIKRRDDRSVEGNGEIVAEGTGNERDGQQEARGRPTISGYEIVWVPIAELKRNPRNARTHSEQQIEKIAASIRRFGFASPILMDKDLNVIAGHGRMAGAERAGMREVPAIVLTGLSDAERLALALADNRVAEDAGWDLQVLGEELKLLTDGELDFDVSITGFDTVEIDRLIDGLGEATDQDADAVPLAELTKPPVSRLGDLWLLGRHRLYCGSALDLTAYKRVLGEQPARMVFTDPPYNLVLNGHVSGKGRTRHPEFVMASGEMSAGEFREFLTKALANARDAVVDGAILFVFMDWRHIFDLLSAGRETQLELKNMCVWAKDNGGMSTFYRSQHELVAVFKNGRAPHVNNFQLGQAGRYRTNLWSYPGVNTFRRGRQEELAMHPTVKPVTLVADAIKDCSHRGDVVLDPFSGSGTTLIAAEKTGRIGCGIELDPRYVDVIIQRWEAFTSSLARHAETGKTFEQMTTDRVDCEVISAEGEARDER